ncbi:xanthine dehydrogenase accessory protein XdhC [Massilia sp. IC2-477]|uniref:xanthine dehydrogenase accessory protein XdhC n=1 Tax=Massilia sp. IC2-477 TaxID=2887198 RepID=UPI001D12CC34|nr:xanthine dehydrogenase accessory protein XdhC [Massilia sp. IC2-477]MCC2954164.1 xanthine dehydrogenase accessory protein XdhC [Massilia sp. IC2-477]
MSDWLPSELHAPAVLVTVARVEGSVPREPGARMLVDAQGFRGTIGGGHLEHRALEMARAMLEQGGAAHVERFPLGPKLGQCCGGIAWLAFEFADAQQLSLLDSRRNEDTWRVVCVGVIWSSGPDHGHPPTRSAKDEGQPVRPPVDRVGGEAAHPTGIFDGSGRQLTCGEAPAFDRTQGTHVFQDDAGRLWLADAVLAPRAHLMLFGAGHVGAAIVRALAELPCRVTWVDEREDLFPAAMPANVTVEATDTPEALVENAPQGTTFLVMTHSHALDLSLSHAILSRPGAQDWFGLIGSATKRRQFEHRLRERGVNDARLATMVCPVGIPGIEGKAPAVIAASVAAQLLTVWEAAARPIEVSTEIH